MKVDRVEIDNNPNLQRDVKSRAVVNTSREDFRRFRTRRLRERDKDQRISDLEGRVHNLETILARKGIL